MKNILISGLINTETTVKVRRFPINYYPIDYPFFGIQTSVSGVAYNIAKALSTLSDKVTLLAMTGQDFQAGYIKHTLNTQGISAEHIKPVLKETPSSVILYDEEGKRQIYCDLKDIQKHEYGFDNGILDGADMVAACNINFNRPLLPLARANGKVVATDVHVLSDIHDDYNKDFMRYADILFLSDEGIDKDYRSFISELARTYGSKIIVMGRGCKGAAMYIRDEGKIHTFPAANVGETVNTVGAGDSLFSGFIHFYADGFDPKEALIRAELFAAAKIRRSGAANGFVTEDELEVLYRTYSDNLKASCKSEPV